jgi:reactive intermediate/imine deaminase
MRTVAGTPLIFVSGQLHADREGNLLEGTIAEQTAYCLKNAKAILEAGGSSLDKVIKTTIFITDMDHFKELNGEYEKWFSGEVKPARSCVAVKTLPKNARVEIEVIAQG